MRVNMGVWSCRTNIIHESVTSLLFVVVLWFIDVIHADVVVPQTVGGSSVPPSSLNTCRPLVPSPWTASFI